MSTLRSRRAVFVYEAGRLHAAATGSRVVPEPWLERDEAFRAQFVDVVEMMCGPDRKSDPAELHQDWVEAYEAMGWRHGPVRDVEAKTHPDMVPFDELPVREQEKDSVFVALCEIARLYIHGSIVVASIKDGNQNRETRETHCKRCTAPLPESVPQSEFCTSECERDYKQFGGWRV